MIGSQELIAVQSRKEIEPVEVFEKGKNSKSKDKWQLIHEYESEFEFETFIRSNVYKTTCTHGKQERNCSEHPYLHTMRVSYYKCASFICCRVSGDTCPFQYKVYFCPEKIYIYEVKNFKHQILQK